jgi:uncharacterized protein DUF5667
MPKLPEPRMRDEFRRELRARLLTEAQTALARRDTAWTFGRLFRPALAFAVVALLIAGGAGTAAASSVAGDPAFALKQAVEDLQVSLTFDDVAKLQTLAQIADHRLAELQSVADDADKAPAASQAYADAVARFRAAVDALQKAAPSDKANEAQDVADTARQKHLPILDELQGRVPDGAKSAIERAVEEQEHDTNEESNDPDRTPRPERTSSPRPSATPRPTDHDGDRTASPRATPTPTPTPRPSATSSDHD